MTTGTEQIKPGKRADARRNIAAILDAAQECLIADPEASIGQIARTAGVGRVTLYGHFANRAELVQAVFTRAVAHGDELLGRLDLGGNPRDALARLVSASWRLVYEFRSLLRAVQHVLPPEQIRDTHDDPIRRVQRLIERGRRDGTFRSDLPAHWLVAVYHTVIHGAADEINAGRLAPDRAADTITATLLAAYTSPGAAVPTTGQNA